LCRPSKYRTGRAVNSQIARALGVSRQRLADLLESDGLAEYAENPIYQRAKLLLLTSQGRKTLDAIRARQALWANALGAEFAEADLVKAREVIDKVLALLKDGNSDP
jgi:DNA-binding MarR family transcriptional regulator